MHRTRGAVHRGGVAVCDLIAHVRLRARGGHGEVCVAVGLGLRRGGKGDRLRRPVVLHDDGAGPAVFAVIICVDAELAPAPGVQKLGNAEVVAFAAVVVVRDQLVIQIQLAHRINCADGIENVRSVVLRDEGIGFAERYRIIIADNDLAVGPGRLGGAQLRLAGIIQNNVITRVRGCELLLTALAGQAGGDDHGILVGGRVFRLNGERRGPRQLAADGDDGAASQIHAADRRRAGDGEDGARAHAHGAVPRVFGGDLAAGHGEAAAAHKESALTAADELAAALAVREGQRTVDDQNVIRFQRRAVDFLTVQVQRDGPALRDLQVAVAGGRRVVLRQRDGFRIAAQKRPQALPAGQLVLRRDVRSHARGLRGKHVVARRRAGEGIAAERYRLAGSDIRVGKGRGARRKANIIIANFAVNRSACGGRRGRAIVFLIGNRQAGDGDGFRRNGIAHACRSRILARAQRDAGGVGARVYGSCSQNGIALLIYDARRTQNSGVAGDCRRFCCAVVGQACRGRNCQRGLAFRQRATRRATRCRDGRTTIGYSIGKPMIVNRRIIIRNNCFTANSGIVRHLACCKGYC